MKKILNRRNIGFVLGIIAVIMATYFSAQKLLLISGFSKGVDAYAHLSRVLWMLTRFPQIHWNPSWDSGTFLWLWSYTPPGVMVAAFMMKLFNLSAVSALNWVSFATFLIFMLSFYYILSSWCGPWLAIPIALISVTTPAIWSWWGHGGNYQRIWGIAFYGLSVATFLSYYKKPGKWKYVFMEILIGFSLTAHMLFGLMIAATIGVYILFAVKGFFKMIGYGLKVIGVGILLAGFWYVPMFATTNGGRFLEFVIGGPVPFDALLGIDPKLPFFSIPVYFTVLIVVTILISFVALFKKGEKNTFSWPAVPAFLIATLISFVYPFLGNLPNYPKYGYIAVFAPFAMFPLIIIFWAYLLAGSLGTLFSEYKNNVYSIVISIISSALIVFAFFQINFSSLRVYDMTKPGELQATAYPLVKNLQLDGNYRFGTDSAFVSDWFNYYYPNLPQTRDYIYQGIPYKTWQYFQEYTIWTQDKAVNETSWLMDWYAIKYFTVGFDSAEVKFDKFLQNPDLYNLMSGDGKDFYVFENKFAKPIMETSSAIPLVVISSKNDYELVARNTARLGWGTDTLIPVWGGSSPDAVKNIDLTNFPYVLVYGIDPSTFGESNPLRTYIESGGKVYLEGFQKLDTTYASWLPVSKIAQNSVSGAWNFDNVSEKISFFDSTKMSPPAFGDSPWKVITGIVTPTSKGLLSVSGKPVLAYKTLGRGEIVWSGLNLIYHSEAFKNPDEFLFITKLLGIQGDKKETGNVRLTKNEPQHRTWVIGKQMSGLIWKESWFPRWSVKWSDSKGKRGTVGVFMAGPALSYIPLPQNVTYPITINADYYLVISDYLGWAVTAATAGALLYYGLGLKIHGRFVSKFSVKMKKAKDLWDNE